MERMFAVAVRDEADLFLWIRLRRARTGDIYYMFPTGRDSPDWKRWDPHGSYHKDGTSFHHKSFDRKIFPAQKHQKPDSNFKGTKQMVSRPISCDEPRAFGEVCDPTRFDDIMEVPISLISHKKYETMIAVDLTEPDGAPIITPGANILVQRAFNDSIPWILVTLFANPPILAPP
jgi:hypothetical protein